MKKLALGAVAMCMAVGVCGFAVAGCGSSPTADSDITKAVGRESSSGTRGAFDELISNGTTSLEDAIADSGYASCVSESNTTANVVASVAQRYDTLGYISLGSVAANEEKITAVNFNGVEATTANVSNGTYTLSRPFHFVYQQSKYEANDLAQNFISYVESSAGQAIISDNGYITLPDLTVQSYTAYTGTKTSLTISGSTSVQPLMNKLVAAYTKLNSGITITVDGDGSGSGIKAAIADTIDLGISSRNLKDSETAQGVVSHQIANDGIAIIVKKGSWLTNVTSTQLYNLYANGTAIENTNK